MAGALLDFEIPLRREDLIRPPCPPMFSIDKLILPENLSLLLISVAKSFKNEGYRAIQQNFNFFFSTIMQCKNLKDSLVIDVFKLFNETTRVFSMELSQLLERRTRCNEDCQHDLINCIKMYSYLMSNFVEIFNISNSATEKVVKKGKVNRTVVEKGKLSLFWEENCSAPISFFWKLLNCEISSLWSPPLVESSLVKLIGNCTLKVFSNCNVDKSTLKDLNDNLFDIVGILSSNHNYSPDAAIQVAGILLQKENLVGMLAEGISNLITKMKVGILLINILGEIGRLNLSDPLQESTGLKNVSLFLTVLGENNSDQMLFNLHLLEPYLEYEHAVLRSAILGIFGNIIVKHLNSDKLTASQRSTRDNLLDLLEAHMHDVNAFVRVKDLQTWSYIVTNQALPLTRAGTVMSLLIGRLHDKSMLVRKRSIQLLIAFLKNNPFAVEMPLHEICARRDSEKEKLASMENSKIADDQTCANDTIVEEGERRCNEEIAKQKILVKYLSDCVEFTQHMVAAIPLVGRLLTMPSPSDVSEAIEFYVTGMEFGVECCKKGLVDILNLMLSKNPSIVKIAVDAFRKIYFSPNVEDNFSKQFDYLTELARICVVQSDLTALELLVKELFLSQDISLRTFKYIFKLFVENVNSDESHIMSLLFQVIASTNPQLIRENIDVLTTCVLGSNRIVNDLVFAKHTMIGLSKLSLIKHNSISFRLPASHSTPNVIFDLFVKIFANTGLSGWNGFCVECISAIIKICERPDEMLTRLFNRLREMTFTSPVHGICSIKSTILMRFIHVCGDFALLGQNYLEVSVCNNLRARRQARDAQKQESKKKMNQSKFDQSELNISDIDGEIIHRICDTEIVTGNGLLAQIVPLLLEVCRSSDIGDISLTVAACTTLGKFMYLSSQLCATNIQLLITLMDRSPVDIVRSNLVIIVGDLASRHPNIIEPWIIYVYKRLEDKEVKVRRTAVLVVARLVLNEIVKAKGSVSAMSTSVVDSDDRIVRDSRAFFYELSLKGNILYNVLPDIISRLMDDKQVKIADFETIMTFLFSLITKNVQNENLVEKLCYRFRTATEVDQVKKLAMCVSKLTFTERCLSKLQDNIHCFCNHLNDSEIYNYFCIVLNKAAKSIKSDSKELVEELQRQFLVFHQKSVEENISGEQVNPDTPKKTPRKFKKAYNHRTVVLQSDNDSEEIENFVADPPVASPAVVSSPFLNRSRITRAAVVDSSSESN